MARVRVGAAQWAGAAWCRALIATNDRKSDIYATSSTVGLSGSDDGAAKLFRRLKNLARPKGFEPLTPRFVVWCSIQLSYGRLRRLGSARRTTRRIERAVRLGKLASWFANARFRSGPASHVTSCRDGESAHPIAGKSSRAARALSGRLNAAPARGECRPSSHAPGPARIAGRGVEGPGWLPGSWRRGRWIRARSSRRAAARAPRRPAARGRSRRTAPKPGRR